MRIAGAVDSTFATVRVRTKKTRAWEPELRPGDGPARSWKQPTGPLAEDPLEDRFVLVPSWPRQSVGVGLRYEIGIPFLPCPLSRLIICKGTGIQQPSPADLAGCGEEG